MLIVLLVAGLAGGGGAALFAELTRPPTTAEVAAAGRAEVAGRWQRLTGGRIFPAAISYLTAGGGSATATRAGIAPGISCAPALDPPVARLLGRHGCLAVLRATYLDESGTLAATIGVVVMRSEAAARAAVSALPAHAGLRILRFPGTQVALLSDANRAFVTVPQHEGPYVFLSAAGSTDGRPVADLPRNEPVSLSAGVLVAVQKAFAGGARPCSRQDVRC